MILLNIHLFGGGIELLGENILLILFPLVVLVILLGLLFLVFRLTNNFNKNSNRYLLMLCICTMTYMIFKSFFGYFIDSYMLKRDIGIAFTKFLKTNCSIDVQVTKVQLNVLPFSPHSIEIFTDRYNTESISKDYFDKPDRFESQICNIDKIYNLDRIKKTFVLEDQLKEPEKSDNEFYEGYIHFILAITAVTIWSLMRFAEKEKQKNKKNDEVNPEP